MSVYIDNWGDEIDATGWTKVRGNWTFPKLHAWVTRIDRDRVVCEPAALEIT